MTAKNGGSQLSAYTFGYDTTSSRLTNVTDGTYSAGYTYLANSPLVSQITLKSNTTVRMTTSKQYDYMNRLQQIMSSPAATNQLPIAYGYAYNHANQRNRVTLNDGSFWIYEYDVLGQVKSGKKYWVDGIPVPGQQFEYGFDDIGNRTSTKAGGDQSGAGLRPASYTVNSLNQYTSRTVPDKFDVLGIATASASVTVNSSAADYRRSEYFQELLTVNNSANPVWQSVSVTTSGGGSTSGSVYVPKATETYGHDLDGNQTNDSRWAYTWDGENRLVRMEPSSTVTVPDGAKRKLEFVFDYQGRRIQKSASIWTNSAWSLVVSNRFLYDGWNLIAELNATNNAVIRSYVWGSDLVGTGQAAGDVGGLLAIKPASGNPAFVAYDGNGNVTALVDATMGTAVAQYEFGAFGEMIRSSGTAAASNPFRFSTKYTDDESDLLYYGYRYYSPNTGRWLNRDPLEERGGLGIYAFVSNDPLNTQDLLGLATVDIERMIDVFHDIESAKIKFGGRPRIVAFLDCVKNCVWKDITKNVNKSAISDASSLAASISENLKMFPDEVKQAATAIELMKYLEFKGLPKEFEDVIKRAKSWNTGVAKYASKVIKPIDPIGKVSEGDVLGGFLVVGQYIAEAVPSGAAKPFEQWIQWYVSAYRASVSAIGSMKYQMGDGAFGGKVRRSLELWGPDECDNVELHFSSGFQSGTGCEAKFLK